MDEDAEAFLKSLERLDAGLAREPHAHRAPDRRPLLELFPLEATPDVARPAKRARPEPRPAVTAEDAFYGLSEKAFSAQPDPRFFYHSTPHDAVAQQILTAIRSRQGTVLLTGELGVGKTIVCRAIVEQMDRRMLTSVIAEPVDTAEGLLTRILADLGVQSRGESVRQPPLEELRKKLQSFVESLGPLEATAVVFVEEAQDLPQAVFNEVRRLCETAHITSLLQVVLVGQQTLVARLRRREYRALHQRIAIHVTLRPLPRQELGDYVAHRLAVAGNARVAFDDAALARIFVLSGGVPSRVNSLCDRVVAHGFERSAGEISEEIVDAAAADLGLADSALLRVLKRTTAALFIVALLLIGAAAAAWVLRDALARAVTNWQVIPSAPDAPRQLPRPMISPGPPPELEPPQS